MKELRFICDQCKKDTNGSGLTVRVENKALYVEILMTRTKAMTFGPEDKHVCGKLCLMRELDAIVDEYMDIKQDNEEGQSRSPEGVPPCKA